MDWETTRQEFLGKLEKAQIMLDLASNLCSRVPTDVTLEQRNEIHDLSNKVHNQLSQLKDRQFHVAILGLEKAGKSQLLNGWLGMDILPNKPERCTYTATEIWSAASDDQQYYQIEYFEEAEFEEHIGAAKIALERHHPDSDTYKKIHRDLEEIEVLRERIYDYLGKGIDRQSIADFSDPRIKEKLRALISDDIAHARASKKIIISTTALMQIRNIVFHDVPGFDSSVDLHRSLARQKLQTCSAILYAKIARTPDRTGPELDMLEGVDSEDNITPISEKVFVALTRIDDARSRDEVDDWVKKAADKWRPVPKHRIIPVCAPAHLHGLNIHIENGAQIARAVENLGLPYGVEDLKKAVFYYLDHERANVLRNSCNKILRPTLSTLSNFASYLVQKYPKTAEEIDMEKAELLDRRFMKWWRDEWASIRSDFLNFFDTEIMPNAIGGDNPPEHEHPEMQKFRERYVQLAEKHVGGMKSLNSDFLEKRARDLALGHGPNPIWLQAHTDLRKEVVEEAMNAVKKMSSDLANTLESIISQIADWAHFHLFSIDRVRTELALDQSRLREKLNHGMSTLFLRFARPAVDLFLATTRGSGDREVRVEKGYRRDLMILSEYYQDKDLSHKDLKAFLLSGKWPSASPSQILPPPRTQEEETVINFAPQPEREPRSGMPDWVRRRAEAHGIPVHGIAGGQQTEPQEASPHRFSGQPGGQDPDDRTPNHIVRADLSRNLPAIIDEIIQDGKGFLDYLVNSVFYAAGFQNYCEQELAGIRHKFAESEDEWLLLVRAAYNSNNPQILAKFPDSERDLAFLQAVVMDLRHFNQLSMALAILTIIRHRKYAIQVSQAELTHGLASCLCTLVACCGEQEEQQIYDWSHSR